MERLDSTPVTSSVLPARKPIVVLSRNSVSVMQNCRMRYWLICFVLTCGLLPVPAAWGAHAYAMWGQPQLAPGFAHLPYVNPDAPKGGELRLVSNLRVSTFDKYYPFTFRGNAPAYLAPL